MPRGLGLLTGMEQWQAGRAGNGRAWAQGGHTTLDTMSGLRLGGTEAPGGQFLPCMPMEIFSLLSLIHI